MRKRIKWFLLLKWWLFFILICVGAVIAGIHNVFSAILSVDFTGLVIVICFVFFIYLIKGGLLVYKMSKIEELTKDLAYDFCAINEDMWFISDSMLTVGMIGTVLGFIIMLSTTFGNIGNLSISVLQASLVKMSAGAGVALYTTAAGLICGLLIRLQAYFISKYIDKISRESGFRLEY